MEFASKMENCFEGGSRLYHIRPTTLPTGLNFCVVESSEADKSDVVAGGDTFYIQQFLLLP